MAVPLLILILLFIFIFSLAWLYNNYIQISDQTARKIEILGYTLLFISIIWEFILKNILFSDFYDINWFFLNQKLLILLETFRDASYNQSFDSSAFSNLFANDISPYLKTQLLTIDIIEAVLQISSAICIAIGRFQELKKNKKHKKSHNKHTKSKSKK